MDKCNHRLCICADNETMDFIKFLMEKYDLSVSAAFRVCAKTVKEMIDYGEEEDRRGGA